MTSERMSPVDTAWLHMDQPGNPADILGLMVFDEQVSLEGLAKLIDERMLKFDRFRQRVIEVDGHPTWEDDPAFDLDRHITRRTIERPLNDETLRDLVAGIGNEPLREDRPLWAIDLIHGLEGGSLIISRLHHCIADGFALAHAMIKLADRADGTPMGETMTPSKELEHEHEPLLDVLVHEANEIARHPSHALDLAKQGAALAKSLGHLLFVPFNRRTFLKKKLSGKRRMAWSSGLDLDTVKAISKARGATVNDVLLTAMTGALRRFLAEGAAPRQARSRPQHPQLRRKGDRGGQGRRGSD
jgi:WS/DGAT/MGAT family acyltransferase